MLISGCGGLYSRRIGAVEQIQHHDNYELRKNGRSAWYDHTEKVEESMEDFEDYFIEVQQRLVNV